MFRGLDPVTNGQRPWGSWGSAAPPQRPVIMGQSQFIPGEAAPTGPPMNMPTWDQIRKGWGIGQGQAAPASVGGAADAHAAASPAMAPMAANAAGGEKSGGVF